MNRTRLALLWLISSAALASLTAWAVLHWHVEHEHDRHGAHSPAAEDSAEQFHAWVHQHLRLSEQEDAALHAAETAFAARRGPLREAVLAAHGRLRAALLQERAPSPALQEAVDRLAAARAALQKATLAHLFEMAGMLDPPRRDQIIQWTHDSLQPAP